MLDAVKKVVICIFDGLRPDRVSKEIAPNLWRFANQGIWYRECRTIFPSMTRVAGCSFATGSMPSVHGIVDNLFLLPPVFTDKPINTGKFKDLMAAESQLDGRLVQADGMGCALARAGKSYAVAHSGSAGSAYMVNHKADVNGHWTFSVRGRGKTKTPRAVDDMVARFGPLPKFEVPHDRELMDYGARVFTEYVLPEHRPDVALSWFVEPDSSYHFQGGIGSNDADEITRRADRHFGRILEVIRNQPDGGQTLVVALSDHGHLTVTEDYDLFQALSEAGFATAGQPGPGIDVLAGGGISVALNLLDPAKKGLVELVEALMGFEQTGMLLSSPSATPDGPIPGTIPYDLVGMDHPRAPDLIWVARCFDEGVDEQGVTGTGLLCGGGMLPIGGGMHGGMSRWELNSMLAFGGAGLPQLGAISDPAHITDIIPTVLATLGCLIPASMTGHPLAAVMGEARRPAPRLEKCIVRQGQFAQSVTLDKGGPHPILLCGGREE